MAAGIEDGQAETTEAQVNDDHHDRCHQSTEPQVNGFGDKAHHQRRTPSPPAKSVLVGRSTRFESAVPQPYGTTHKRHGAGERRMAASSTKWADHYASTGTSQSVAGTSHRDTSTSVPVVAKHPMALRNAVSQRKSSPVTPLVADTGGKGPWNQWKHLGNIEGTGSICLRCFH